MKTPDARAVVIPFGVPDSGRGLGVGLAALVHTFARIGEGGVALAQLFARPQDDRGTATAVEAFVPPHAWKELPGAAETPSGVTLVLTGAFEPPTEGRGMLELVAFDPHDGSARSKSEALLDGPMAGRSLVAALDRVCHDVGGDLGALRQIEELGWDALESVLQAERCIARGSHRASHQDCLSALLHLGRAVGDAPEASFPAVRLAAVAMELASAPTPHDGIAEAARRALARACDDAPGRVELLEATAALALRADDAPVAEGWASRAIELAPARGRPYALLSEARRLQQDLDGALDACACGIDRQTEPDAMLLNEHGIVLATRGDRLSARDQWERVLAIVPAHSAAFANLATVAMDHEDVAAAQVLVDHALALTPAPPETLRRAIELALSVEPPGIARASRVVALCRTILERVPEDAVAALTCARALAELGETAAAEDRLRQVELSMSHTPAAAEAQRMRLTIRDPAAALAVQTALRAAREAPVAAAALEAIEARARRLAEEHGSWPAWLAAGVAAARAEQPERAREHLERATRLAPGAGSAHLELCAVLSTIGEHDAAVVHGRRARALEGDTPRALGRLAGALFRGGEQGEAERLLERALAAAPDDAENVALRERMRRPDPPAAGARGWLARLLRR